MTALQALIGFTAWTLLLVLLVFAYRGARFLTGKPINSWPRGAKPADDAPLVKRIEDAHANCLENLPLFAVIGAAMVASWIVVNSECHAPLEKISAPEGDHSRAKARPKWLSVGVQSRPQTRTKAPASAMT